MKFGNKFPIYTIGRLGIYHVEILTKYLEQEWKSIYETKIYVSEEPL